MPVDGGLGQAIGVSGLWGFACAPQDGVLVACNSEIGSRCPRETRRAAALRMLAMPMGIAVLRALHHTPSRAVLDSHFTVTGH
jgi:hypothetical protein